MTSCACGSQGALSHIAVVPAGGTFNSSSERYDFVSENLQLVEAIVGNQGITGSLDLFADHIRNGPAFVQGSIMMNVSAKELENWLPRILRGTKVSNDHIPGNDSPAVDIMVKRDKVTFVYTGLQVDKMLLRASATSDEPSLVEMMLTFVGVEEEEGTWPDPEPTRVRDGVLYWLQADSTLDLNGAEYPFESFNLQFDNMLQPLIRNSLRPVCIRSEGRRVKFNPTLTLCEDSADNLYWDRLDGDGQLSFLSDKNLEDSDSETTFKFGRLYGRKVSPNTRGKTETFLPLDLMSYPGASLTENQSLRVTNRFPA
jgi:hypothetical protein